MVVIMAPPGNGTDLCFGAAAYQNRRAPMTRPFIVANEVIMYGYIALGAVVQAVWWVYRDEPILAQKGFFLSFMTYVMVALAVLATCLWATSPFVDPINGQTLLSCRVQAWLLCSVGPFQSGVGLARLAELMHRARYARGARRVGHVVGNMDDETASHMSGKSHVTTNVVKHWNSFTVSVKVLAMSFGYGSAARRLETGFEGGAAGKAERRLDEEALLLSKEALTTQGALILIVATYIPIIGLILIMYATADPFRGDCPSCDVWGETAIFMVVTYCAMLIPRFRLAYLLRGEPDPNGVVKELGVGAVVVLSCCALCLALAIIDPNHVDFDHIFNFQWLFALGVFLFWVGTVVVPLAKALMERRRRNFRVGVGGGGGGQGAGLASPLSSPRSVPGALNRKDVIAMLRDPQTVSYTHLRAHET